MQSIYASKFYKSSTRKNEIRAAIENPINVELVQQLSEYLDEEYTQKRNQDLREESEEVINSPDTDESRESDGDDVNVNVHTSAPNAPHVADHHLSDMLRSEEGGEPPIGEMSESVPQDDEQTTSEDTTVNESTDISGSSITASGCIQKNPVVSIAEQTDSIMGLLNSVDATSGVRLVSVKNETELWVYYKDAINLNNVMEPTIAYLNSADYGYLNFNRLARTDNAIVFDITQSSKPVEPIAEVADEK